MPVFVRNHPHSVHPPERQADGSTLLRHTSGQNALKFASFCGAPAQGWYTGSFRCHLAGQATRIAAGHKQNHWSQWKPVFTRGRQQQIALPCWSLGVVIAGKVGPLIRLRMSRATVSGSLLASSTTKARARGRAALLLPLSCSEASGLVCVCRREQRAKDWIRFVLAVGQSRNGQQTEGIKGVVCPFSSGA